MTVLAGLLLFAAQPDAAAQTCEPYCYPPPTAEPCVGEAECYDLPANVGSWEGLSDGRLNPHLDEYYSVWCADNSLRVYRAVPETQLLKTIPIAQIRSLGVNESRDLGDFMTLLRNTDDTITIYGSNGNLAPQPGEKAFSLSECRDRGETVLGITSEESESPALAPMPTPLPSTRDNLIGEIAFILRHLSCAGIFALPGGFGLLRWTRRKRKVQ
jgi:hypothetical protein